jgi:predicted HicB family RNase H-like nuclease
MFEVKKVDECHSKTFRLPDSLIRRLEIIAKKEKISVNNLVVQACNYALNEYCEDKGKLK